MIKLVFPVLSVLFSSSVYANFELEGILHKQDILPIEDSVVEENESVETIDSTELEGLSAGSSSVDDILRLSAAATTSRGPRSSGEAPQVRGLDTNKIFVMVDGSRQNFQQGHTSMIALDTENLKAVEVYKSPIGSTHTGSIGGGVNFVTKKAQDFLRPGKKSGSEFKTQVSSVNQETVLNAKNIFRTAQYSGFISATNSTANDILLSDKTTLDNSSYEDNALLAKFDYRKWGLKLEYFQREDDAPTNPANNPPSDAYDYLSDNVTRRTNITLDYQVDKKNKLSAYRNFYLSEKKNRGTEEVKTREIETIGTRFQYKDKKHTFGLETYRDSLDSDIDGQKVDGYPSATNQNYSLYALGTYSLSKKLKVYPGLKYAGYQMKTEDSIPNKNGSSLSKEFKSTYALNNNVNLHASYSEGFKSPSLVEVFPSGIHIKGDGWFMDDNFFIPNEDLTHETSKVREAGITINSNDFLNEGYFEFGANFFTNDVKDYIYQEIELVEGTTQFINLNKVKIFGTELEAKYLADSWEAKLTYARLRGKNLDDNYFLEDLPADQYNLDLRYFVGSTGMTLGYLGTQAFKNDRVNPQTIQKTEGTEDYIVHNIFMNQKLDDFDISFRIDNVSNTKYKKHASHLYESAQDIKFGLKYKINTY